MKIVYIKGLIEENSIEPQKLSELLNEEIKHIQLTVINGNINERELNEYFEQEHTTIKYIIGASTGSYIARHYAHKYALALISFNPIVEIEKNNTLQLSSDFKDIIMSPIVKTTQTNILISQNYDTVCNACC